MNQDQVSFACGYPQVPVTIFFMKLLWHLWWKSVGRALGPISGLCKLFCQKNLDCRDFYAKPWNQVLLILQFGSFQSTMLCWILHSLWKIRESSRQLLTIIQNQEANPALLAFWLVLHRGVEKCGFLMCLNYIALSLSACLSIFSADHVAM